MWFGGMYTKELCSSGEGGAVLLEIGEESRVVWRGAGVWLRDDDYRLEAIRGKFEERHAIYILNITSGVMGDENRESERRGRGTGSRSGGIEGECETGGVEDCSLEVKAMHVRGLGE
ncbi:uncharacterized protein PGTG_15566 [Puccinia graminis f. sp. tritici CRL 75-36-700-3]|uniref:Uncharacterized protein n=1 Tax=Puccinia graminis f. sp. tritici (strain CRL 75-36-700-3 / race SCCL) TaxID=418459 RepID=E3KZ78_PUCGT|nr:uncharacterized protein PGTG_15566 [Puccinia graminis f. sp. tritici CRL 75-36-700-3]EFP89603.1 hypothetical protein PGTG_15566 [Puccinia graminis f. sp. tritici CRL 75-36-700-3]